MPCRHRVRQGAPGTMKLKVTRTSNVNQIAAVVEDLDRTAGRKTSRTYGTSQLEAGVSRPALTGHSYNIFLSAVRKSTNEEGSVRVTISIDGANLINSTCSVNGTNPTGSWTIIV